MSAKKMKLTYVDDDDDVSTTSDIEDEYTDMDVLEGVLNNMAEYYKYDKANEDEDVAQKPNNNLVKWDIYEIIMSKNHKMLQEALDFSVINDSLVNAGDLYTAVCIGDIIAVQKFMDYIKLTGSVKLMNNFLIQTSIINGNYDITELLLRNGSPAKVYIRDQNINKFVSEKINQIYEKINIQ